MKSKDILYIASILFLLWLIFFRSGPRETVTIMRHTDTLIVRDTIREVMPEPYAVYLTRIDTITVFVPLTGTPDSLPVNVPIPIEDKEYRGENYLAVVRGYRPELLRLDLYPETRYIYTTEIQRINKMSRFGVGVQVGYGFTRSNVQPYVGVGIQYNLWSF